jgi:hypothetical protein
LKDSSIGFFVLIQTIVHEKIPLGGEFTMKLLLSFFIFLISISSFASDVPAEYSWLEDLANQYPWVLLVLSALGTVVILAQVVVAITPTKKDDIWIEGAKKNFLWKLVDIISSFAPIKKK